MYSCGLFDCLQPLIIGVAIGLAVGGVGYVVVKRLSGGSGGSPRRALPPHEEEDEIVAELEALGW